MLLVVKLKIAAKASLVALSIGATLTQSEPGAQPSFDAPVTIPLTADDFAYRLAGDFHDGEASVDAPLERKRSQPIEIMKYQVSAAEYGACARDGACAPTAAAKGAANRMPAVMVSWQDAQNYAAWLSQRTGDHWRLPTDEEWAAAAGSRFHDDALNLARNSDPSERWLVRYDIETADRGEQAVRPQGAHGENERGLADLSGNVWEWTDTCFSRYALVDGAPRATSVNCGVRVVEGAHRAYIVNFVRDARGGGCAVGKPPAHLGMRLVREPRPIARQIKNILQIARLG